MAPVLFVWIGLLALSGAATLARAIDLGSYTIEDSGFAFTVTSDVPLAFNKMNSLVVKVEPENPVLPLSVTAIRFDARMPAHNHGMVVKPRVTQISANEFRIDGVKLHMVGDWELIFGFSKGKKELAYKIPMSVPATP